MWLSGRGRRFWQRCPWSDQKICLRTPENRFQRKRVLRWVGWGSKTERTSEFKNNGRCDSGIGRRGIGWSLWKIRCIYKSRIRVKSGNQIWGICQSGKYRGESNDRYCKQTYHSGSDYLYYIACEVYQWSASGMCSSGDRCAGRTSYPVIESSCRNKECAKRAGESNRRSCKERRRNGAGMLFWTSCCACDGAFAPSGRSAGDDCW